MTRRTAVVVLTLALLLGLAAPRAYARNVPSAGDQYVEQVPTAAGARPVINATSSDAGRASDLRAAGVMSPSAAARLRAHGGSKLAELTVATSAALGAPQPQAGARGQGRPASPGHVRSGGSGSTSSPSLPSAALNGASGGGQLPWLTIVLAVLTAAAVAVAVYERRSSHGQP